MRQVTNLNEIFPFWEVLKEYIKQTIAEEVRDNAPRLGILKEVIPDSLVCVCSSPFNTSERIPAILFKNPTLFAQPVAGQTVILLKIPQNIQPYLLNGQLNYDSTQAGNASSFIAIPMQKDTTTITTESPAFFLNNIRVAPTAAVAGPSPVIGAGGQNLTLMGESL